MTTQDKQEPIRRVDLVNHATLDSKDKTDPYKYGTGVESRPYRYGFASVDRAIEHKERRKAKAEEIAAAATTKKEEEERGDTQQPPAVITLTNSERAHDDDDEKVEVTVDRDSTKIKSSSSATGSVRRVDLVHTVFDAPNKDENSGRIGYIPSIERKIHFQQMKEGESMNKKNSINNENDPDEHIEPRSLMDDIRGCLDPTKHTVPSDDMYNTRHEHDDVIAPNGGASGVAPDAAYRF